MRRRLSVIQREWQRIDPRYLDEDEQRYWAAIAGRQVRFEERAEFVQKLSEGKASKACLEQFLATAAAENPNRRLRMMALADRVSMTVERADFDDLVTLVIQAPTWEKDRIQGARILLRAIGEGKANAPDQILERWTWKLARSTRKAQDRRVSAEFPEAKRLLGALANSRGHRHEENAAKLVNAALELPLEVGVALLASAEGYTPRATKLIEGAREKIGTLAGGRLRACREPASAEGAHEQAEAAPAQAPRRPAADGGTGRAGRLRERSSAEAAPPASKAALLRPAPPRRQPNRHARPM